MTSLILNSGLRQFLLFVSILKQKLFAAAERGTSTPTIHGEKYLKRLLWYLLGGTRGGPTRAEMLKILRERPLNANQLAEAMRVDYKTIQHHLGVLEENGLVAPSAKGAYGAMIFLTPKMEEAVPFLEEIWSKIGRTKIRTPSKEDR